MWFGETMRIDLPASRREILGHLPEAYRQLVRCDGQFVGHAGRHELGRQILDDAGVLPIDSQDAFATFLVVFGIELVVSGLNPDVVVSVGDTGVLQEKITWLICGVIFW